MSGIACHIDLHPSRNVYLTSRFILSVLFLIGSEMSTLHVSRIPHHTDLHLDRNVYQASQFILSVLFLTGSETSVVPTCVQDPLSH